MSPFGPFCNSLFYCFMKNIFKKSCEDVWWFAEDPLLLHPLSHHGGDANEEEIYEMLVNRKQVA